jgi:hypothetical protein
MSELILKSENKKNWYEIYFLYFHFCCRRNQTLLKMNIYNYYSEKNKIKIWLIIKAKNKNKRTKLICVNRIV